MYIKPVATEPSHYTQNVLKYKTSFVGWEVVKLAGKVFELPPGTCKHVPAKYLENILQKRTAPYYGRLLAFQLKGRSTRNGTEAGYYLIAGKLMKVDCLKPSHRVCYSTESVDVEGTKVYGESGILVNSRVGEVGVEFAFVSGRALLDIETFYKYILVHTNWVNVVYVNGDKSKYTALAKRFGAVDNIAVNRNLTVANGKLLSPIKEYDCVY